MNRRSIHLMTNEELKLLETEKLAYRESLEAKLKAGIEWFEIPGWRLSTKSELVAVGIMLDLIEGRRRKLLCVE